jgi:hypothetical protein
VKTITLWELIDFGVKIEAINNIMKWLGKKELCNDDIFVSDLFINYNINIGLFEDIFDAVLIKYKIEKFCMIYDIFSKEKNKIRYMRFLENYEKDFFVDNYWNNFYDFYVMNLKNGYFFIDRKLQEMFVDLEYTRDLYNFKEMIEVMMSLDFWDISTYFERDSFSDIVKKYFD